MAVRGLSAGAPLQAASRVCLAVGLMASVGLVGCTPFLSSKVTVETSPELPKSHLSIVAILPFEALTTPQTVQSILTPLPAPSGAKRSDINVAVPEPPGRLSSEVSRVPPEAAEKVTRLFYERVQGRGGLTVLSPDEARRVIPEIKKESPEVSPEQLAGKVAERLHADAALIGRVLVYQERVGSKWGGDPATVGFEVKLVAQDGTILWVGNYYEKQRPMTEDFVGWLERRGVFVTAEELAEYGVAKLLKKFPIPLSS